jgi:hypothetical protein
MLPGLGINSMRILGIVALGVALTLSARGRSQALLASGGEQDFIAMQAANDYLSATRGPGCTLMISRKLTHVGWEWDFDCRALAQRQNREGDKLSSTPGNGKAK